MTRRPQRSERRLEQYRAERLRLAQYRSEQRRQRRQQQFRLWGLVLDSVMIAAWGGLLLFYWLQGDLGLLIHPAYRWLTIAAGIVLLAIALSTWFGLPRQLQQAISPLGRRTTQHWLSVALLLGIALAGYVIPLRVFASELALQRNVDDFMTLARPQPQTFRIAQRPEDRSLIDWIRTLNVYPEPSAYAGQPAEIMGFSLHTPDLPDNYLMLSQFVITCCAADVYPVGLPVQLETDRSAYPQDQWFQIRGVMESVALDLEGDPVAQRRLALRATEIEPIPEPQDPYAY